jgi:hypothetical protein
MPVTTARRARSGEGIAPDCSRARVALGCRAPKAAGSSTVGPDSAPDGAPDLSPDAKAVEAKALDAMRVGVMFTA